MHIFDVAFSFSNIVIIGCVACVVGIADNKTEKRKRLIFILLLCSTVVSVMFISFSHSAYIHYYMVLVPLIVVTISILFARFRALVSQNNISKLMSDLIVFAVTLCVISNSSVSMLAQIIKKNAMDDPDSEKQTVEVQTIIDVIENDADEDDTVQVLGNDCLIFLLSDLKPASKFIYDIPVAVMSDEVHQLFAEEWEKSPPSYVVYDKYHYSEDYESDTTHKKWAVAKLESDYEIIHEAENYSVYRRIG
jgi:Ca2+/Na+ antiporter